MKVITMIEEKEGEGLASFLGKLIAVHCSNYIYQGTLIGINATCIKLAADACCVFETGEYGATKWKDAQALGKEQYVMIQSIERFEAGK